MITYPLSLPTAAGISDIVLRAENAVLFQRSPFTFKRQVQEFPGKVWHASVGLPPMNRPDAEQWVSFLMSLKGQVGTFLLGDPMGVTPQGSASTTPGTPVVDGAGQTGSALAIRGAPVSATGYLKAGDYIQLGSTSTTALYKVLVDVDTDVSGNATVDVWPDVVTATTDGATVVVSDAKGLFHLNASSVDWSVSNALLYGISFDALGVVV